MNQSYAPFNAEAFKRLLGSKGVSITDLAKCLGISKSAMHRKMYGISDFTRTEIIQIREILEVGAEVLTPIFFDLQVS